MKPYNLLVTGVGGQGTVVASDILAAVGLAAGYDVKKSDVLGLAVRGGAVVSHVRWADTVHSPIVPEGKVDILLAFELLEGLRWLDWVNPEGAILINDQRIFPVVVSSGVSGYPSDEEVSAALLRATSHAYKVPGLDIAQELGNSRVLNVALLGAMSGLIEIDPQLWVDVIKQRVPAKALELNVKAFWQGREALAARAARRPSRREGNRMKILVINPNTSESMTAHLARELMQLKAPETELTVVNPEHGPVSIESAYDEALAIPPTLALIKQAEQDGYDAAVIACFSDPGLHAARELVSIPVIGIQEATLHVAAQLGFRFTITTTFPKRVPAKIEAVKANGLEAKLASVRPLNMTVLEMDRDPECTKARLIEACQAAATEDGAEVVILGCAGLAGYAADVEAVTGMKVLDPSPIALKTAEMLVGLGLKHSKRGLFAQPPVKLIK